jgi:sugar phosphate isomerase/epimerase
MSLSRREFIAASAAATAGLTAAGRARAADEFGGFTVGIQSYTFRDFKPVDKALKQIQSLGVKNAEFYNAHLPPTATPEQVKAFKKTCGEFGVKPVAFGVESFSKNHDANKKKFDFGKALGIQAFSADPDPASFDSLDKLVEEYGIAIAIHPHGPDNRGGRHRWWSAEVILNAVKDHNKKIGTCLDTGHLIRMGQLGVKLDPVQQVKAMGERNFGLHLKDHDNKWKTDVPFGDPTGVLDVLGVLKALREVKFAGYISIEYEANPQDPTADVKKCLEYFKEQVKKLG